MITSADISRLDFSNPAEVIDAARQLAASGPSVREAARRWIEGVDGAVASMPVADLLPIADCYEAIHRLAYDAPASRRFIGSLRLRAFEAYVGGDRAVDTYALFRAVTTEIDLGNRAFIGRPLTWQAACLDRWHRQLRYGLPAAPSRDTLRRAALLLTSNLRPFEGSNEPRFKQRLAASLHLNP